MPLGLNPGLGPLPQADDIKTDRSERRNIVRKLIVLFSPLWLAMTCASGVHGQPFLEETQIQQVHSPAVGPLLSEEAPPRSEPLPGVAGPVVPEETREARVLRIRSNVFKRAGASNVLVVRARVEAAEAEERALPAALGWGEDPAMQVATRVTLDLVDEICGRAGGSPTLTAWYAGGVLPNGHGFRTSQMMSDPVPGQEYIFWLQKLDGDWFLASGRHDMFDVVAQDTYQSWPEKAELSARALQGACQ
jgi:hypothetical protein